MRSSPTHGGGAKRKKNPVLKRFLIIIGFCCNFVNNVFSALGIGGNTSAADCPIYLVRF
jgi:hypothetical protein